MIANDATDADRNEKIAINADLMRYVSPELINTKEGLDSTIYCIFRPGVVYVYAVFMPNYSTQTWNRSIVFGASD